MATTHWPTSRLSSKVLIVVALITPPLPGRATVMVPLTLKQLTERSQLIVTGQVRARHSYWTRNRRLILTRVTLSIHGYLKGRNTTVTKVTFSCLGGQVGRVVLRVTGAPHFKLGEEVVVFLNRRRNNLFVTGMAQGKFTIFREPRKGRRIVARKLGGVLRNSHKTRIPPRMTLRQLKARVKSTIKKKAK